MKDNNVANLGQLMSGGMGIKTIQRQYIIALLHRQRNYGDLNITLTPQWQNKQAYSLAALQTMIHPSAIPYLSEKLYGYFGKHTPLLSVVWTFAKSAVSLDTSNLTSLQNKPKRASIRPIF